MSVAVKTPDEVAEVARQLWALCREGHQETVQLWLTDLVDRLRKDKPVVLVDRVELAEVKAQLSRVEKAIGQLAPPAPSAQPASKAAAPPVNKTAQMKPAEPIASPAPATQLPINVGDWVGHRLHPEWGKAKVTEIDTFGDVPEAFVQFGSQVEMWHEWSELQVIT